MAELTVRIVILMTPEQVKAIDQYRLDHRLSSRGDTIRVLVEKSLETEKKDYGSHPPKKEDG